MSKSIFTLNASKPYTSGTGVFATFDCMPVDLPSVDSPYAAVLVTADGKLEPATAPLPTGVLLQGTILKHSFNVEEKAGASETGEQFALRMKQEAESGTVRAYNGKWYSNLHKTTRLVIIDAEPVA